MVTLSIGNDTQLGFSLLGTTVTDATTGTTTRTMHFDLIPMTLAFGMGSYFQAKSTDAYLESKGMAPVNSSFTQRLIPFTSKG
jgi:hypothetical protein